MEIDIELTSTQGTGSGISLLERGYNIFQCGVAHSERALRMSGRVPGLGYFQIPPRPAELQQYRKCPSAYLGGKHWACKVKGANKLKKGSFLVSFWFSRGSWQIPTDH